MEGEAYERRRQEMQVLSSIYQDSVAFLSMEEEKMMVLVSLSESIQLKIIMLANYPNVKPTIKLHLRCSAKAIDMKRLNEDIDTMLSDSEGNEVLFLLIEFIRERLQVLLDDKVAGLEVEAENTIASLPTGDSYVPRRSTLHIIHGDITAERKSTFLSHYCLVDSMDKVNEFYDTLLADKKIASATHNILAYRFTDPLTGALYQDFDDDGENAAGGRVLEMIRLMRIDGVAVVVSRWFGGILLGADRFKLICASARTLLEKSYLHKVERQSYLQATLDWALEPYRRTVEYLRERRAIINRERRMLESFVGFCTGFILKCTSNSMANQRFLYRPWEHMIAGGIGAYICYNMSSWDKQLLDNVNIARVMRKMRPIHREDVLASYLTASSDNPLNKKLNSDDEE